MTKQFFDIARQIAGGSLTQIQVDKLNEVVDFITPKQSHQISDSGVDLIRSFESLELKAYDDGVGVPTIGYGTTIYPNGKRVQYGDTCTIEQAKSFMKYDLKRFTEAVNGSVKVQVNQNQFDALVSLTYNIGISAFNGSTLLKKLNASDYKGAAAQFDVWNKAGGKVMRGLTNRRAKERKLFEKALE